MNGRGRPKVTKTTKNAPEPPPVKTELPKAAAIRSLRSQRRAEERKLRKERQAELLAAEVSPLPEGNAIEKIMLGPRYAYELLEHNRENRPLNHPHIERIAMQIKTGKWRYNGNTIKISEDNDVLDGQHRLWAIVESNTAVPTVVVRGIKRDAFATIDAISRPRSGADTLALAGVKVYHAQISMALTWLLRWQRGVLETYKAPENRIENSDIEAVFASNPAMARAVEVTIKARTIAHTAILAFAYYVMHNANAEVAETMMKVMLDPAGTSVNHPFFRLRLYFLTDKQIKKDPIHSIALIFKAANFVAEGRESVNLSWRSQGERPEPFPKLAIAREPKAKRA
jgi:hypothetical protein